MPHCNAFVSGMAEKKEIVAWTRMLSGLLQKSVQIIMEDVGSP